MKHKVDMKTQKSSDKINDSKTTLMVVFDSDNVINLPKAEVSSFLYKKYWIYLFQQEQLQKVKAIVQSGLS